MNESFFPKAVRIRPKAPCMLAVRRQLSLIADGPQTSTPITAATVVQGDLIAAGNRAAMAAKKKVPPPQPVRNRSWQQLSKAEQSAAYSAALQAYGRGAGPNPQTRVQFFRSRAAAGN
jgi:hypothetical protein